MMRPWLCVPQGVVFEETHLHLQPRLQLPDQHEILISILGMIHGHHYFRIYGRMRYSLQRIFWTLPPASNFGYQSKFTLDEMQFTITPKRQLHYQRFSVLEDVA